MRYLNYSDFEIGNVIGTGTVGTIYRVTKRGTDEQYALKLLSPHVCTDELTVSRFKREILILSKLSHPNIVEYIGQGVHEKQLFYLMELVRGGTLKELLQQNGQLTWQETAECGRQIASALQYSHNHGVIHRDIKPGNIYLKRNGQLKVGDFGIARDTQSTDLTDVGLTVGTYAYMSPELVRGQREISGKSDLYALGCLLFELLTGRAPYLGDNFAQIFEQHLHSKPPSVGELHECPKELDTLITNLLAKDPADRPFNVRAVQGILIDLLDAEGWNVERPVSEGPDTGAATVTRGQQAIADRLVTTSDPAEPVEWWKLAALLAGILFAIFAAKILN